jgi:hypothetical protein
VDEAPDKFPRAALHWHSRFVQEVRGIELDEAQAILATLATLAGERRANAAYALADLPQPARA